MKILQNLNFDKIRFFLLLEATLYTSGGTKQKMSLDEKQRYFEDWKL